MSQNQLKLLLVKQAYLVIKTQFVNRQHRNGAILLKD